MKIAVISDIHSNPRALEKVLADAKEQGCERTICLGDIVGYGYDPVSCIDMCRDNNILCCLGNHDAGLIGKLRLDWFSLYAKNGILRQRQFVNESVRKYLEGLPYTITEEYDGRKFCFSHGTFSNPGDFDYITELLDASREIWLCGKKFDCLFVGHTHYAEAYGSNSDDEINNFDTYNAPDLTINCKNFKHLIVNAGSVGYPRNQHCSFYVVFDTNEQKIHYRKLPFNFQQYIREMDKRNIELPLWMENIDL